MAKMTTEELLSVFEEMSVLELKEFLDSFEEKFDVTAAAPVAVA
ncbi:50S ribosomal protein L7/L12, partial [Acidimicrobiia bacterium]|nr:50S ribosomal protein L7/L12 [Acidimicrobiia bacterium]